MQQQSIALVNDDPAMLEFLRTLLIEEGYPASALFWTTGEAAYELIRDQQPGVVVLDIRMERPDSGSAC